MACYLNCPKCGVQTPDADVHLVGGTVSGRPICPQCGEVCSDADIIEREVIDSPLAEEAE